MDGSGSGGPSSATSAAERMDASGLRSLWATAEAREAFALADRAGMHDSPGTRMIGSPPFAYDEFEVVAIAEGPEGFLSGPGPKTAEALSRG